MQAAEDRTAAFPLLYFEVKVQKVYNQLFCIRIVQRNPVLRKVFAA